MNTANWVSLRTAAKIIETSLSSVRTVLESAKVRTRVLPGLTRVEYHRGDVERLAAEMFGDVEASAERRAS